MVAREDKAFTIKAFMMPHSRRVTKFAKLGYATLNFHPITMSRMKYGKSTIK